MKRNMLMAWRSHDSSVTTAQRFHLESSWWNNSTHVELGVGEVATDRETLVAVTEDEHEADLADSVELRRGAPAAGPCRSRPSRACPPPRRRRPGGTVDVLKHDASSGAARPGHGAPVNARVGSSHRRRSPLASQPATVPWVAWYRRPVRPFRFGYQSTTDDPAQVLARGARGGAGRLRRVPGRRPRRSGTVALAHAGRRCRRSPRSGCVSGRSCSTTTCVTR